MCVFWAAVNWLSPRNMSGRRSSLHELATSVVIVKCGNCRGIWGFDPHVFNASSLIYSLVLGVSENSSPRMSHSLNHMYMFPKYFLQHFPHVYGFKHFHS